MMNEKRLNRKAERYASGVVGAVFRRRRLVPGPSTPNKALADYIEGLIAAAYYNGHQSGEVFGQGRKS